MSCHQKIKFFYYLQGTEKQDKVVVDTLHRLGHNISYFDTLFVEDKQPE